MTIEDLYSATYAQARSRFLGAAERVGARVASHVLAERGLEGEELAMDVASLGPATPAALLAVSSGLHGVEGFAGSALQLELLGAWRELAAGTPELGMVLVHAVNPHGFSRIDRANEGNVDLNRNFVDHPDGQRPNPDYEQLAESIAPPDLEDPADGRRLALLEDFIARHGERRFENALSGGQYTHPGGLFYGGTRREWSAERLLDVARRCAEGAGTVAWIDVHTGLGERGALSILSDLAPEAPAYRLAARWYGSGVESIADGRGLSVVTHGSVDLPLLAALAAARAATMVTAEMGTVAARDTFLALRARNWLRHHGPPDPRHPRALAIREQLADAFAPRDAAWRATVLGHLRDLVLRTVAGLTTTTR